MNMGDPVADESRDVLQSCRISISVQAFVFFVCSFLLLMTGNALNSIHAYAEHLYAGEQLPLMSRIAIRILPNHPLVAVLVALIAGVVFLVVGHLLAVRARSAVAALARCVLLSAFAWGIFLTVFFILVSGSVAPFASFSPKASGGNQGHARQSTNEFHGQHETGIRADGRGRD